jgi:CTP:molybdopterin cytidylyltransferase MocA
VKVLGVVLAAGAGSRFGEPKALARSQGQRWVDHAVAIMRAAGITDVIVISGAWHSEVPHAEVLHNPRWEVGLSSSVDLAVAAAQRREVDRLLLTLVDLPSLTADHVRAVMQAPYPLVQASYDGEPSHPVAVDSAHFTALRIALNGDRGARGYLLKHGVHDLALPGHVRDVDYPIS